MLVHLFLGLSLAGAEWVLYLLIGLSILSVAIMLERAWFYRKASKGLPEFRRKIREEALRGNWDEVRKISSERITLASHLGFDLESGLVGVLVNSATSQKKPEILTELTQDALIRAKLEWERNLSVLATIGSNAPFIGLFGTVLGIIRAFHDLSQQAQQQVEVGAQTATAGIAEALVATAIGLLVAIPAVVAFNYFQRRIKTALAEAEALKSFLIGRLGD